MATTRVQANGDDDLNASTTIDFGFTNPPTAGNLLVIYFGARDDGNNAEPVFTISTGWEIVGVADPMEFHTCGIAWRVADGTAADESGVITATSGAVGSRWFVNVEYTNPAISDWAVGTSAFNGSGSTNVTSIASGSTGVLSGTDGVAAIVATSRTNLIDLETDIGDSLLDLTIFAVRDAGSANFLARWLDITSTAAIDVTATENSGTSRMGVGIVVFGEAPSAGQSIVVPAGALQIAGLPVTVAGSGEADIPVPMALVTLSGLSPSIAGVGVSEIVVPSSDLLLSGQPLTLIGAGAFVIPVGEFQLAGIVPQIAGSGGTDFSVPPGMATLLGVAPSTSGSGEVSALIPPGLILSEAVPPQITGAGDAGLIIPPGLITFLGEPVTMSGSGDAFLTVPAAVLTIEGNPLTLATTGATVFAVPAALLSLIGLAPSLSAVTFVDIDGNRWTVDLTPYRLVIHPDGVRGSRDRTPYRGTIVP